MSMEHEYVYSPHTCLTDTSEMEDIRVHLVGKAAHLVPVSQPGLSETRHVALGASSFNIL